LKSLRVHVTRLIFIAVGLVTMATLGACSFVETVPGSEQIVISQKLDNCTKVGETKVKVLDRLVGIERNEDAIAHELQILARNAAFDKRANTITPLSEVEAGQQTFALYRCRPTN